MTSPIIPQRNLAPDRKIVFATIGSYVISAIGTVVVQMLQDGSIISLLPSTVSAILAPFVPALATFITGYLTKHRR